MTVRRAWQALAVLTICLYAALAAVWFGRLVPASGGLMPFDGRVAGYSPAEGHALLEALGAEGRAIYLGPVGRLDTLFPICLALLLAMPMWRRMAGAGRALTLLPLAYLAADLAENARVAALLRATPPVPDAAITAASTLTIAKFALLAASAIACAAIFVTGRRR